MARNFKKIGNEIQVNPIGNGLGEQADPDIAVKAGVI